MRDWCAIIAFNVKIISNFVVKNRAHDPKEALRSIHPHPHSSRAISRGYTQRRQAYWDFDQLLPYIEPLV